MTLQLVRYFIVGVSAVVSDYVTFMVLYYMFSVPLGIAVTVGLFIGLSVSFIANKLWTFEAEKGSVATLRQLIYYMLLFGFNTLFTYYFIKLLQSEIPEAVAKPISVMIITVWNYLIYKRIIFVKS